MDEQNDDRASRRKFLTRAGLAGAAAVTVTARSAAAKAAPSEVEFSPGQISKLEEIVKNFITNAKVTDTLPAGITLAVMKGHGSHAQEGGGPPPTRKRS